MSKSGHQQTANRARLEVGYPPKTDIQARDGHVRFVPDSQSYSMTSSARC
jgi:hypothetical protein